jgi:hypothetical protein
VCVEPPLTSIVVCAVPLAQFRRRLITSSTCAQRQTASSRVPCDDKAHIQKKRRPVKHRINLILVS